MTQHTPSVGTLAETADGQRLGIVAEVEGDYLRIDPTKSDEEAFWLNSADVATVTPDRAQFNFDKSELISHVVPVSPGQALRKREERIERMERGPLDAQQEQRKLMLEDVAEDRREIREDGVDLPGEDRTVGEPVERELDRLNEGRAPDA